MCATKAQHERRPDSLPLTNSASLSPTLALISTPSPQVTANRKLGKGEKRGRSGGGSEPALVRSSVQLLPMKAELTLHLARSAKYYLWREWMWTFPNQPTYPNNKYLPQWSPGVQKNKWVFRMEEFPFIPQYALTEGSTMGKLCPRSPASSYP